MLISNMEIGSEYWLEKEQGTKKINNKGYNKDEILLISGRTAIDYALEMITRKTKINNVYFPSYCCQSMLEPFLSRNIEVLFYNVSFKNGKFIYDIDCDKKCDLFFAMNYFGFNCSNMDYYIDKFKQRNVAIIEDSTHSILSERKYNPNSDFVVASLRKWFPIISGGILINSSNKFELDRNIMLRENHKYTKLKREAMIEKGRYMQKVNDIDKKEFLEKFHRTEEMLNYNYKNYKIDDISYELLQNINIEEIQIKRKKNIRAIYDFLRKQKKIEYVEEIDFEKDCLLFVPIFVPNDIRNRLKGYLIKKDVYCPNHWPIPDRVINDTEREIYDMELSLICDQRYTVENIKNYTELIEKFI